MRGLHCAPLASRSSSSPARSGLPFHAAGANETGYRNLVKLISTAHLDGFHYKPRIDKELLATHAEGLIGLSGCLAGEINSGIQADTSGSKRAQAAAALPGHSRGGKFLRRTARPWHGGAAEMQSLSAEIAKDLGVGLVAANDVHFLRRSDHDAHDVMLCIGTGKMVQDESRMRYVPELYFKSAGRNARTCSWISRKRSRTRCELAERCNLDLEFGISKYPEYPVPEGQNPRGLSAELCDRGPDERYRRTATDDPQLISDSITSWACSRKPGSSATSSSSGISFTSRRSAAFRLDRGAVRRPDSLVAYVLGITDIDPLQFGLIFERFLNPDRISPPDIDVDFCECAPRRSAGVRAPEIWRASRRADHHLRQIEGEKRGARRRPGDRPEYGDADRIAKMIPNELNITLDAAAEKNADLKRADRDRAQRLDNL